jgi:hypothetical protein
MNNKVKNLIMTAVILIVGAGVIWGGIYVYNNYIRPPAEEGEKTVTIIVINVDGAPTVIEATTEADYLHDLLIELAAEGRLVYEFTVHLEWGVMLDRLGSLVDGAGGLFIFSYSDDTENTNQSFGTLEHNEKTFVANGFGVSGMPVKDGHTYVFALGTW